jgi:hypothetical protein
MSKIGKEKNRSIHDYSKMKRRHIMLLQTVFVKQCYETLIDVAQNSPNGRLPVRTNFYFR